MFTHFSQVQRMEELMLTLEQVSGYSIQELIAMFAQGYTLALPAKPKTFNEMLDELGY